MTRLALIREIQESIQTFAVYVSKSELRAFIRNCRMVDPTQSRAASALAGLIRSCKAVVGQVV